jgi:hypothetical protein
LSRTSWLYKDEVFFAGVFVFSYLAALIDMGSMHYRRILESVSVLGEFEIYFHSDVYYFSDGEDFLMCTLVSAGQDDGQFSLNIHFKT